ncbi:MAG: 4Fe-4S dicluster domain-containing protein [Dehalococcoidales bacterium]|nr:4Fe-4S dicluster domain-containing protein [Dehalococcoidales bacterium]
MKSKEKQVLPAKTMTYPQSQGYLVVDRKKCAGCQSCMLACSLVHEGVEDISLSRIQVIQNSFGRFPEDTAQYQCRQCVNPLCVQVCPTGACYVDTANGNVRLIDQSKCEEGCKLCIEACPYIPQRVIWDHRKNKVTMCDLCINTLYWNEKGGPSGKQACIEACPMQAIKLVNEVPAQLGTKGYDVNLRNEHWAFVGLPID